MKLILGKKERKKSYELEVGGALNWFRESRCNQEEGTCHKPQGAEGQ